MLMRGRVHFLSAVLILDRWGLVKKVETWTGITYRPFKKRWKEHLIDCRGKSNMSKNIRGLNDKGIGYDV